MRGRENILAWADEECVFEFGMASGAEQNHGEGLKEHSRLHTRSKKRSILCPQHY